MSVVGRRQRCLELGTTPAHVNASRDEQVLRRLPDSGLSGGEESSCLLELTGVVVGIEDGLSERGDRQRGC